MLLPPLGLDLAFFCGYHYPGSHDNSVRMADLSAGGGGHLGLGGVVEVAANVDAAAWLPLLGAPIDDRWVFDSGPDLVADSTTTGGTATMTWSVDDVRTAAAVLDHNDLERVGDELILSQLGGLRVRLTDRPAIRATSLARRTGNATSTRD